MRLSLEQVVREVVAAHLEVPSSEVTPNQRLMEDLGLPPLGVVLIALDVEDLEGFHVTFEDLVQAKTVGDLCGLMRAASLQRAA